MYYLYYRDTMQHKAMSLMSRKMAAAQALEGEFSEDGLAAMAGEDNMQMALAKNLAGRIDDADMQRSWGKVKSGPKKKKPGTALADAAPKPLKHSPLDNLPLEFQMVAESLIESQFQPVPPEAASEFDELADRLAAADRGFAAVTSGLKVVDPAPEIDPLALAANILAAEDAQSQANPDVFALPEPELDDPRVHAQARPEAQAQAKAEVSRRTRLRGQRYPAPYRRESSLACSPTWPNTACCKPPPVPRTGPNLAALSASERDGTARTSRQR